MWTANGIGNRTNLAMTAVDESGDVKPRINPDTSL
jgi:hypothetical protein